MQIAPISTPTISGPPEHVVPASDPDQPSNPSKRPPLLVQPVRRGGGFQSLSPRPRKVPKLNDEQRRQLSLDNERMVREALASGHQIEYQKVKWGEGAYITGTLGIEL